MTEVAEGPAASGRTGGIAHRDSDPRKWLILFTILATEVMDIVDGTIVNVAVPSISRELHTSSAAIQWIVGGYALTFAVGMITGARLGDVYGRKEMFMLGVVGFTVASLACGLAPSDETLILFRLLQGFAAALMIPQGFGMVRDAFSQEGLPKAFAFWGPMVSIGAMLGPIFGGLIIELNLWDTDWRGIFLVNVPLGVIAIIGAIKVIPPSKEVAGTETGIDVPGSILMAIAAGLVIYPLIQGREEDWPWWIFAIGAAGFAVLGVFAWYERRRQGAGKSLLIATSIFRKPAYVSGVTLVALFFAGMTGLLFITTLYLQFDQHFTAIHAGLTMIPWSLGTAVGAFGGVRSLLPKLGRTLLHVGVVFMVGAVGLLLVILSSTGHNLESLDLAPALFLMGIGIGMMISPLFNFILAGIEDHELGSGSGVLNAMQQFGAAIGIAVIGTIFFSVAGSHDPLAGYERSLVVVGAVMVLLAGLGFLLPKRVEEH